MLMLTRFLPQCPIESVAPDVTLRLDSHIIREAFGFPEILQLTLPIGKDIAVGVFSAWLYDKLKGRATKLQINGTEVPIGRGKITRGLTEKMKKPN